MNEERLNDLTINNEGFAFDSRTGNTYSINATGLLVINGIKEGATNTEIATRLTERFDIDRKTADRDLGLFLDQLERNKLLKVEVFA